MTMIKLTSSAISKRFNQGWLFRDINFELSEGDSMAITGHNGSGKSTLIKLISGFSLAESGEIKLQFGKQSYTQEKFYNFISIVAPYQALLEEFTALEHLSFHFRFKKRANNVSLESLLLESGLTESSIHKQVKYFSSGMKQRLSLIQAFNSDCPILLLDEPTAFLDTNGVKWYKTQVDLMKNKKRIIIVASNDQQEYDFAKYILNLGSNNKITKATF